MTDIGNSRNWRIVQVTDACPNGWASSELVAKREEEPR